MKKVLFAVAVFAFISCSERKELTPLDIYTIDNIIASQETNESFYDSLESIYGYTDYLISMKMLYYSSTVSLDSGKRYLFNQFDKYGYPQNGTFNITVQAYDLMQGQKQWGLYKPDKKMFLEAIKDDIEGVNIWARIFLCEFYLSMNDYINAEKYIMEAYDRNPENLIVLENYFLILFETKQYKAAIRMYDEIIDKYNNKRFIGDFSTSIDSLKKGYKL